MNEAKEYYYNKVYVNVYLVLSIIVLCFFFISLIALREILINISATLILPIILYFMFKDFIVIKLYKDYFEFKAAPLRPVDIVKYGEIAKVETNAGNIFIYPKSGKKITISLGIIDKDKREEIILFFEKLKK